MKLLTIAETANILRTSASQVRAYIKTDKDFPRMSHGKKSFRIDAGELDKWVMKQTQKRQGFNA